MTLYWSPDGASVAETRTFPSHGVAPETTGVEDDFVAQPLIVKSVVLAIAIISARRAFDVVMLFSLGELINFN
jgi:hypothetical protein